MSTLDLDASNPGRVIRSDGHWRIEMLGGLVARDGDWTVSHFPGRPVAALLARLTLFPQRSHAREELIELLWPGVAIEVGRNRLRQVLSTLRSLLDTTAGSAGGVLIADRSTVRIDAARIACDALEFEAACRRRDDARARQLYRGELLPGFYDAWIVDERLRLEALHGQLLEREASGAAHAATAPSATADAPDRPAGLTDVTSPSSPDVRLPSYLSSFVGREGEMRRCLALVDSHRLVTLTGMGGCGKTRLAAELARACRSFDVVLFVGLADCRDGTELADHLRVAARLPPSAGNPLAQVLAHLKERRALLVFDNFEQLVGRGGADALAELLAGLPLAHALVTSRRTLQVPGEQEQVVSPLPVPDVDDDLPRAMRNPAVALFIDRARGVRGDFRLTAANREDLLVLCRTLEGLPLALEIAASRIRTYSLREMRSDLAHGLSLLVRSAPQAARDPRHASLQAAIDWSWRLLTPRTQDFLGDLSVFRGGCSSADVRAVTGAEDTHDLLDLLVADSLLVASQNEDDDGSERRFQMLESVREFVVGRIDAARGAGLRQTHRAYFLSRAMALAERHQPVATTALGNFIEALQSALDDGEHELALALLLALKAQWESVGTPPEALALMRRAAQTLPTGMPRISNFLSMFARLLLVAGHSAEALACAARALVAAGEDPALRAEAMFAHTRVEWVWKRQGANVIDAAVEGVRLAREAGTRDVEASALSLWAAITLWGLDRPLEAERVYEQAESVYLALGNPRGALQALHGRMGCLYATKRYALAIEMGTTLEKQSRSLGNVEAEVVSLNLLVACYAKLRRHAEALAAAQRETRLAHRHHKIYNIVHALWGQAHLLARLRRPEEAAVMAALGERYWTAHLGPLPAAEQREAHKVRRLATLQIGPAGWAAAHARGSAMPLQEGIRLGCGDGI